MRLVDINGLQDYSPPWVFCCIKSTITNLFEKNIGKVVLVKLLVSVDKIKGKEVFGKRGVKIGKIEDVELDADTWAVEAVDVKIDEDVAKLYGEKAGFLKKEIVSLPANMMGPIGENVILREEISDLNALRGHIRTERGL
jgi:sporulation protein YlmC with PRC-barrel domain